MQTHAMFSFLSAIEQTERVDELEGVTSQLLSDVTDLLSSHADVVERLEVLEAAIIGNHLISIHSYGCILITARNEVGARLCFYRCVWFCSQGGCLTRYTPGTRYTPQDQVHPPGPGTPPGTRYTPQGPGTPPSGTRYTPRDLAHPLEPGTPPGLGTPPRTRYTPQDQVHPLGPGTSPNQVHPPGPGTPPGTRYTPWDKVHPCPGPGRYGLRAGSTHPTGMHSCFNQFFIKKKESKKIWYAILWNLF